MAGLEAGRRVWVYLLGKWPTVVAASLRESESWCGQRETWKGKGWGCKGGLKRGE